MPVKVYRPTVDSPLPYGQEYDGPSIYPNNEFVIYSPLDPGAVGAYKLWVDLSDPSTPTLYQRDDTDTGWVAIGGGAGSTDTLEQVLQNGNETGSNPIASGLANVLNLIGTDGVPGDAGSPVVLTGGGGDGGVNAGSTLAISGGSDGVTPVIGLNNAFIAASGPAGLEGQSIGIIAGAGDGGNQAGVQIILLGGSATDPGRIQIATDANNGVVGEALVSDGDDRSVWGGVQSATGEPTDPPAGFLPIYINDSTGDLYVWNGSVWIGPYIVTP